MKERGGRLDAEEFENTSDRKDTRGEGKGKSNERLREERQG
jgi:hypothetical protein